MLNIFSDQLTKKDIQRCFILSKKYFYKININRFIIDEQEDFDKYFTLEMREFYEFMVRLTIVLIKEDWPLFYAVERLLLRLEKILNID